MVLEETNLFDAAVLELRKLLPEAWTVEPANRCVAQGGERRTLDGAIDVRAPDGTNTTFAVEVGRSFAPRDIERLLGRLSRVLRGIADNVPVLVVAPWLSPRTEELL